MPVNTPWIRPTSSYLTGYAGFTGTIIANGFENTGRGSLWFDPVMYGADPLGIRDSATGLRLAISAVTTAGGGYITLSSGTFLIGSTVTGASNVWIRGAGMNATTIKATTALSTASNMIVLTGDFTGLSDVLLDGTDGGQDCLTVTSSNRAWVRDIYVQNARRHGITFTTASSGNYRDIKIKSCTQTGLFVNSGTDNDIVALWVGTCTTGVRVQGGNNNFTNAHIWGNTGNGVEVRASDLRFGNCYVETNGTDGIDMFNARGVLVTGSNIWKNTGHGIDIQTMDNVSVTGCECHDNGSNGINTGTSTRLAITGNQCYDSQQTKTQDIGINLPSSISSSVCVCNVSPAIDHTTNGIVNSATNSFVTFNIT